MLLPLSGTAVCCRSSLRAWLLPLQACTDPNKSIIVMVHDACEVKCGANQLNLAATPFAQLASLNVGKIRIQYRAVGEQQYATSLACISRQNGICSCDMRRLLHPCTQGLK
jgi:hypothetical protein